MAERDGSSSGLPVGEELDQALNDIFHGRGVSSSQELQFEFDRGVAENQRALLQAPYIQELFDSLFPRDLPIGDVKDKAVKVFFYFPAAVGKLSDEKYEQGDFVGAQIASQINISGAHAFSSLRQVQVPGGAGRAVLGSEEVDKEAERLSLISQVMEEVMAFQTSNLYYD